MLRPFKYFFAFLLSVSMVQVAFGAATSASTRSLPIAFEANRGQAPAPSSYVFHRDGVEAQFSSDGVNFDLADSTGRRSRIQMSFVGGHAEPQAENALSGHANYFIGNDPARWLHNVPLYSALNYADLYQGISLSFYGNGEELEHDFTVNPGSDPSQIAFMFDGASSVSLAEAGDLVVRSGDGSLRVHKPIAYQLVAGGRKPVEAGMVVAPDGTIHFSVGSYDHSRTLVIDPVLVFATYLGGTGTDVITGVTTDATGNILVTGYTTSIDFPTMKPLQAALVTEDAFVTKLDPTGKTLVYSTYLGGSGGEIGGAIKVDPSGNVIVAGTAMNSIFPHAGAIVSPSCQTNNQCFFLASLTPDGSTLNYAGIVGGAEGYYVSTNGGVLAVDASGNAYLAGITDDPQFQITPGTLATSVLGYPTNEAFVLKVDPTGKLIYSTVIPGNASYDPSDVFINVFFPNGITVDGSGNATIGGKAGLGLPTTAGVVGGQFPNAYINVSDPTAGFVLQLNATASAINFASYLPGTEMAGALAADAQGNLWTTGWTAETTLPVSANAYQKTAGMNTDGQIFSGFLMELNPQATNVLAATYLGSTAPTSSAPSSFTSIALDSHRNVFVGGSVQSAAFPLRDPFVTEYEFTGSVADMILAEMNPDLSSLLFSSYMNSTDSAFGGSNFSGIAVDRSDNLIATGSTNSRNFPTTAGSFEPQLPPPTNPLSLPQHSFVARIDLSIPAPAVCFDVFSVAFGNVNATASLTKTVNVTNCGNALLTISAITSSDPTVTVSPSCGTIAAGAVCPLSLTFTPVSSLPTSGSITLSSNAQTIPQVVTFTGQGLASNIVPSRNPFSLGHILVGTQGPATFLQISNQGQSSLVFSGVTLSGPAFSIASNSCSTLGSRQSCGIQLIFAPTVAGTSNGSLIISSNDPVTPHLTVALSGVGDAVYAVPSLASNSAPTVLVNKGPTTLQLSGSNFYPQSVVMLGGTVLSSTYLGNGSLNATLPASLITALGELPLTATNPAPGGGISNALEVTPYQTLLISPAALVSVPATGLLYAAIPASASTNPNTVIPIDPTTGVPGTPIAVNNDPRFLAASSDGAYLYVANQASQTVQRINLKTNAVERTFPYTPNIYCSTCTNVGATDLETVPGSPQEVLLAQGSWLTLYNDAGRVNYVPNDGICCYADPTFSSVALAGNPLAIYGLPFILSGNFFQKVSLTSSGLQYTRTTGGNNGGNNTTGSGVISDGTLLYTNKGQVWNPATQTMIGTFPVTASNAGLSPNSYSIALDASLGEIYSVGVQSYGSGSSAIVISAYELKTYTLSGTLAFPPIYWPTESNLVRWGADGMAFIGPGLGLTDQELYIFRSSVVSPQGPNPTPVVSSISPASAVAGGSAFTLTVNGTGFVAPSVIEWNGSPLATTYVSSQKLTASVPASAIAQSGTAQVVVLNPAPGGGSSVAQLFTVVSPTPVATLSKSQLTFGDQTQGLPSAVQTVTLTSSGNGSLTITSISASGDFKATSDCGASVAVNASCTISATFTPSATGSRTGTLTITDNAANSPQTISLSGNGVAAFSINPGQGGSTSATVSSGGTAAYNLSLTAAPGISGTVNLSCSGAPQYAACTVSPTSLNLTSGGTGTFTVSVSTSTTLTASAKGNSTIVLAGMGLLALLTLPLVARARRRSTLTMVILCSAFSLIALGVTSCGGGGGGGGGSKTVTYTTSPGTYNLTLTASTASATASQRLTLVVQ